jgi:hypothetical protein
MLLRETKNLKQLTNHLLPRLALSELKVLKREKPISTVLVGIVKLSHFVMGHIKLKLLFISR